MNTHREQRVFLVRMWREDATPATEWRGSVHDIGSGRRFYFTSPVEIADLISGTLLEPPPARAAEGKP